MIARAGCQSAVIPLDFQIVLDGRSVMILQYGPGSITTRHRPALAFSRLVASHQVPVVVVTNGLEAEILDGFTGRVRGSGLGAIPDRKSLLRIAQEAPPAKIDGKRAEREARILYAYEVDGACACDDRICRSE